MNDNLITIGTGSLTSMTIGIINNITLLQLWEVGIYGFVGAGMGYLAKVLIKIVIKLIKK